MGKINSYLGSATEFNQKNKTDKGKDRLDLLPVDSLEEISRCFSYGAKQYGARSWETSGKVEYSRLYAAILRHLFKWWAGEKKDKDSGMSHLTHVATNSLMLLAYALRKENKLDDRPVKIEGKTSF